MSLFTESSWEADAVGDKLSKQLFVKKKKGKKDGKKKKLITQSKISRKNNKTEKNIKFNDNVEQSIGHGNKEFGSSGMTIVKSRKNIQPAGNWIATVEREKVKGKKRKLQSSNDVAHEESPRKKSKVKPGHDSKNTEALKLSKEKKNLKNRSKEESDGSNKEWFLSKKDKAVINKKGNKSMKDKEKSVQSVPSQSLGNRETKSQRRRKKLKLKKIAKPESDTPRKYEEKSRIKSLDVQKLEKMLAQKEMKNSGKSKVYKEPESLRERMMSQLRASRFRFLNETLYNNESSESKKYFKEDPEAFAAYHSGYRQQVEQWPLNPLDVIISSIKKMSKDYVIADFGCGEARLAESVTQKVHSFDLVAINDKVKACDMAHTPLLTDSINVVVFCLSLMGTNLADYLVEANRVLKKDGILKIADVESRFENVDEFISLLGNYGFVNTWKDLSHNLFYFMDFKKTTQVNGKTKNLPEITLKPCLYKKR